MKDLWRACGEPAFMRRLNGWLTLFWIAMVPISIATGWVRSITYVSALSIWALVSGHWSTWQAARVEEKQADQADEVVEAITEQTDVDRARPGG